MTATSKSSSLKRLTLSRFDVPSWSAGKKLRKSVRRTFCKLFFLRLETDKRCYHKRIVLSLEDLPASKPEQMALMDTRGVQEGEPGKVGALQCGTLDEMKEQMKQFTESVHQKASSVVSWVSQLEGGSADNSRLQKLLGFFIVS